MTKVLKLIEHHIFRNLSGLLALLLIMPVNIQAQPNQLLSSGLNPQVKFTYPKLKVSENQRYLTFQNGTPFFWLGGTSWGMPEWLTREDIDHNLNFRTYSLHRTGLSGQTKLIILH